MLKMILSGMAVILIAFCILVALQPADYNISRSRVINAPSDALFTQVNDFHNWNDWSPWAKIDPNAKVEFSGPAQGTGAAMTWDGNSEVGAGRLTITESRPSELIRLKLEFYKPMEGVSQGEFTFVPEAKGTRVTWSMSGTNNFVGKAVSLIMNCEKMVGGMYDKGLNNLANLVEKPTQE